MITCIMDTKFVSASISGHFPSSPSFFSSCIISNTSYPFSDFSFCSITSELYQHLAFGGYFNLVFSLHLFCPDKPPWSILCSLFKAELSLLISSSILHTLFSLQLLLYTSMDSAQNGALLSYLHPLSCKAPHYRNVISFHLSLLIFDLISYNPNAFSPSGRHPWQMRSDINARMRGPGYFGSLGQGSPGRFSILCVELVLRGRERSEL